MLLTYQGVPGPHVWEEFLEFIESGLVAWSVKYWTATFEDNASSDTCHAHIMLQFHNGRERNVHVFAFRGIRPNASTADLMNEGICGKRLQQSIDRGRPASAQPRQAG